MKRTLMFIALVAASFTANAQLLWKVSGNGAEKPSYIFGTHHVATSSICDRIEGFDQAYQSVDQVIGEVETAKMNDQKVMMQMMPMMMMPEGKTLSSLYTEEEIKIINNCLAELFGSIVDITAFDSMKPVTLSSTIQVMLATKHFPDFMESEGIDSHLQSMAKTDGKKVGGLETVEFQIDMLYNEDMEKQAEDLLEMAEDTEAVIELLEELAEIYCAQDIKKINRFMHKDGTKKELEKLLYGRNRNWIEQMKVIIPETPTMFVVGAGHLPGKNGVLDLLEKAGFDIEPVW